MNKKITESYEKLCKYAQEFTGIDITKAHGRRKIHYVRIRASIMVAMLRYMGITTVDLGEIMCLDHSTIIHHRNNHNGRYRSDDEYAHLYDHIARHLTSISENKDGAELNSVVALIRQTLSA
jgi:hypothetical protein